MELESSVCQAPHEPFLVGRSDGYEGDGLKGSELFSGRVSVSLVTRVFGGHQLTALAPKLPHTTVVAAAGLQPTRQSLFQHPVPRNTPVFLSRLVDRVRGL